MAIRHTHEQPGGVSETPVVEAAAAWRRGYGQWAAVVVIVGLTVVAYLPALQNAYVWDDDVNIHRNPAFDDPNPWRAVWTGRHGYQYYPLTFTSFLVEFHLAGGRHSPTLNHAINVALQAANAVLLMFVLRRLGLRRQAAWLAALLFAIHPVQVESVAWATERKNLLSGLFYLLAFVHYLKFISGAGRGVYGLSLLWFVLAGLSKSVTLTLTASLLVVEVVRGRGLGRRALARLMPFAVVSLALAVLAIYFEHQRALARGEPWHLPAAERTLVACRVPLYYASRLALPLPGCFIPPKWHIDTGSVASYWPALGLSLTVLAVWFARRRLGAVPLIGTGHYLVTLLPACGLIDFYFMRYAFVQDHFQYLAGVGLFMLIAHGACAAYDRLARTAPGRVGMVLLLVAAIASLTLLSNRRARVYANAETLWRDTIRKNAGSWMPHYNLGVVLNAQGRYDEGIDELAEAVRLEPDMVELRYNLGVALLEAGRARQAVTAFREVVAINPDHADALNNLGVALQRQGNDEAALSAYRRAVAARPDHARALNNLGAALLGQGQPSEAVECLRLSVRRDPNNAETHNNLAIALAETGRFAEAARAWREALRLRPDYTGATRNLARLLAMSGRYEAAITTLRRGLEHDPDDAGLAGDLAWQLATCPDNQLRDADEAVELALRAVEVTQHQDPRMLHVLAAAYAAAGRAEQVATVAAEALKLARAAGDATLADQIDECLQRYRAGKNYAPAVANGGE